MVSNVENKNSNSFLIFCSFLINSYLHILDSKFRFANFKFFILHIYLLPWPFIPERVLSSPIIYRHFLRPPTSSSPALILFMSIMCYHYTLTLSLTFHCFFGCPGGLLNLDYLSRFFSLGHYVFLFLLRVQPMVNVNSWLCLQCLVL